MGNAAEYARAACSTTRAAIACVCSTAGFEAWVGAGAPVEGALQSGWSSPSRLAGVACSPQQLLSWAVRIGVAAVFVVAAVPKAGDLLGFVADIRNYQVFPNAAST
ncbi:MAG: hypothetical protein IPK74_12005 [Deltaproteobacteria bacterium]|nr:hypothetical protein [Deltaproteobacteria bacterium]